jgi:hypothetical protein
LGLLVAVLQPTVGRGYRLGEGPDFPVYLWWTRVAAAQGLSLVGSRPGTPPLLAVIQGTLHVSTVTAVAAAQYALVPAMGLAAIALIRNRAKGGRWGWVLAGVLAGLFALHLAGGYVSNLIFAVAFVAAGAALAEGSSRGVIAAALLLGGGGLAHPEVFALGVFILATTAAWSYLRTRDHGPGSDVRRVGGAIVGSALIVGAGLLSTLIGPPAWNVDTSKDSFLRRVGLRRALEDDYRFRFRQKAKLYAPVALLALAWPGYTRTSGFARRFLLAWGVISLAAVPVGYVTGRFPPERIITFAFVFPILAASGVLWVWERLRGRRLLALAAAVALIAIMCWTWLNAWAQQRTFVTVDEVTELNTAAQIAATLPPGTHLVYIVNDVDATAVFLATHAENLIRATLPPDRVKDAYVYVGDTSKYEAGLPTSKGHLQYDTLSRELLREIPVGSSAIFVLKEFDKVPHVLDDPTLSRWSDGVASSVPGPHALPAVVGSLQPSSPAAICAGAILAFVLMTACGMGWSLWTFGETVGSLAAAPAFGTAMIVSIGLVADRLGIPIAGSWGPTAVSAVVALGGYTLFFFKRKPLREPAHQVHDGDGRDDAKTDGQEPPTGPRLLHGSVEA